MGFYALAAPISTTALAATSFSGPMLRLYGHLSNIGDRAQRLSEDTGLSGFAMGPDGSRRRQLLGRASNLGSRIYSHPDVRSFHIQGRLSVYPHVTEHPQWNELLSILSGPTELGLDGKPRISKESFNQFITQIPYLFSDGTRLMKWLDQLDHNLPETPQRDIGAIESSKKSSRVMRAMINWAASTAPPSLWVLRQILSTFQEFSILRDLNNGMTIRVEEYAAQKSLSARQLAIDLSLLYSLGYIDLTPGGYVRTTSTASYVLEEMTALPPSHRINMTGELIEWFGGNNGVGRKELIQDWLGNRIDSHTESPGWMASTNDIEIGYRVVPLVLALNATGQLEDKKFGKDFNPGHFTGEMRELFEAAGILNGARITALGMRMLTTGPGPYGIIGAYHPYTTQHAQLLQDNGNVRPHAERASNVAASRDANRRDFKAAVKALGDFIEDTGWTPTIAIEHALGHGVAIQEFVNRFGEDGVRFFGFDYELAALEAAKGEQMKGTLPDSMIFAPPTDIAKPERLIKFLSFALSDEDISSLSEDALSKRMDEPLTNEDYERVQQEHIIMMVGAGFHEARLDDDAFVEKLKILRKADILNLVIEASALTDEMKRASAWQSYNAVFDWAHETSGQRARAPVRYTKPHHRRSWNESFEASNYRIEERYSPGGRALFPYEAPVEENPPLSHRFLAVPKEEE